MILLDREPPIRIVHDDPVSASRLLGLLGSNRTDLPVPSWVVMLDDEQLGWIEARWDLCNRVFTWQLGDHVDTSGRNTRSLDLSEVPDLVVIEVLASLALDASDGDKVIRKAILVMVSRVRMTAVTSVHDLAVSPIDDVANKRDPGWVVRCRAWTTRFDVMTADPNTEWDRDQVRLVVVKAGATNRVLDFGKLDQPWLRTLVRDFVRMRVAQVSDKTAARYVHSMGVLSRFLSTRRDQGMNPRALTGQAMDAFNDWLAADTAVTPKTQQETLWTVSVVLTQAHALSLTDACGLRPGFCVKQHHYPKLPVTVRVDRSFPDASFRFMMGQDPIFGDRVHALARTIPADEFAGEVFVQGIHASANWGRRPADLCALFVDRVRNDGPGATFICHDNSKSGQVQVWLPIVDRHAMQLNAWTTKLRNKYPMTSIDKLRLLPAPNRNPHGTRALTQRTLSCWFGYWLELLEQAIVLGRLHTATGSSVADLCRASVNDVTIGTIRVGPHDYELATADTRMLADYTHALTDRYHPQRRTTAPPAELLPLFPDPFHAVNSNGVRSVDPSRFDGLGPNWPTLAAQYACGGIPGMRLGADRINPDELIFYGSVTPTCNTSSTPASPSSPSPN